MTQDRKSRAVLKKVLAAFLAVSMAVGAAGCSGGSSGSSSGSAESTGAADNTSKATGAYEGLDISKPVTLTFYNLGDIPADMQKVQDEANSKYFKPLLNCTVNFDFLSWSDYKTKYDLILAGGDQVDLIYTANWCYYSQEANKGAFKELTMDYIKKFMPQTYKSQAAASWDQMSLNGKIYGVSQNSENATLASYKYIAYRDDLRKKYNLPEIKDIASMQNYLFAIAEKEKGIQGIASAGENDELRNVMVFQANNLNTLDPSYDFVYQTKDSKAPPSSDIFYVYTSDYFKKYAETMAEWASKGVWSRNAINNTVSVNDAYANGKGALIVWNGSVFTYGKTLDDSKIGTTAYADITPDAIVKEQPFSGDAVAIAHASANPDRAAMVLDLMKNNVDLNRLLEGGIEGTHYKLNSDNTRSLGPDAENYSWDNWSWGIRMKDQLDQSDVDSRQKEQNDNILSRKIQTDIDGFTFDETPVKSEMAVVNSIRDEYRSSFELGAYGDKTDETFEQFNQELDQGGLQTVLKEFLKQYEAYVSKKK